MRNAVKEKPGYRLWTGPLLLSAGLACAMATAEECEPAEWRDIAGLVMPHMDEQSYVDRVVMQGLSSGYAPQMLLDNLQGVTFPPETEQQLEMMRNCLAEAETAE